MKTQDLSGVVDIGQSGGSFFTSSYGAPDVAFQLLLSSAREALAVTSMGADFLPGGLCAPEHARRAETYLSGVLLRDANFMPTEAVGQWDHRYAIDFEQQILRSENKLYIQHGSALAFLRVKIEGKFTEHLFTVQNPASSRILTQFRDDEISTPKFFEEVLPNRAYEAMVRHDTPETSPPSDLPGSRLQLQLFFEMNGCGQSLVVAEAPGSTGLLVIDVQTQKVLCTMPQSYLAGLEQFMDGIRKGIGVNNQNPSS